MNKDTCPKCNAPRTPGSLECRKCGVIYAKAEKATALKLARENKEEPIKFSYKNAGIAAGIIFFLIVGFVTYVSNQSPSRTYTSSSVQSPEYAYAQVAPTPPEPPATPILKSREQFQTDSKQICYKRWTKRGELDSRMYNHCMEGQVDGYNELLHLHQYAEQSFYSKDSFPYCKNQWTKRGIADARMMAHCLQREVEGIKDVMYYRKQYGDERVNQIAGAAILQFHSWNMAAYKVKQHFQ